MGATFLSNTDTMMKFVLLATFLFFLGGNAFFMAQSRPGDDFGDCVEEFSYCHQKCTEHCSAVETASDIYIPDPSVLINTHNGMTCRMIQVVYNFLGHPEAHRGRCTCTPCDNDGTQ